MKNPFLNSSEMMNKNLQASAEMGTKLVSTVFETVNQQVQQSIETNKKMAELVTSHINTTTQANLQLWNQMTGFFNKQVEQVSNSVQEVQQEIAKNVKK